MLLLPPMFYGRSERYKDYSFAVSETDMLTQLLGLAPTSKQLYASDGFSVPGLFWLGAKVGRAGLERVLGLQVENGVLSVPEAYKTAEQIPFRNMVEPIP